MVEAAVEKHGEQGDPGAGQSGDGDENDLAEHSRDDSVPALSPEVAQTRRGDRAIPELLDGEAHRPPDHRIEIEPGDQGEEAEARQAQSRTGFPAGSIAGRSLGTPQRSVAPVNALSRIPDKVGSGGLGVRFVPALRNCRGCIPIKTQ